MSFAPSYERLQKDPKHKNGPAINDNKARDGRPQKDPKSSDAAPVNDSKGEIRAKGAKSIVQQNRPPVNPKNGAECPQRGLIWNNTPKLDLEFEEVNPVGNKAQKDTKIGLWRPQKKPTGGEINCKDFETGKVCLSDPKKEVRKGPKTGLWRPQKDQNGVGFSVEELENGRIGLSVPNEECVEPQMTPKSGCDCLQSDPKNKLGKECVDPKVMEGIDWDTSKGLLCAPKKDVCGSSSNDSNKSERPQNGIRGCKREVGRVGDCGRTPKRPQKEGKSATK